MAYHEWLSGGAILLGMVVLTSSVTGAGVDSDSCTAIQQQVRQNQCYAARLGSKDKELNETYSKLVALLKLPRLSDDLARLRIVQKSWIAFKDKACDFEAARYKGGSLEETNRNKCLARETAHRTEVLSDLVVEYEKASRR